MKILFLFIDGVGYRDVSPDNPVNDSVCPTLCRLMNSSAVRIDACLGIAGLPQSATGQATMFTGVNASEFMGRHCEGFPGPSLRSLIEKDNIFMRLRDGGKRCRFADAYMIDSIDDLRMRRFKSVTTVMSLTCPEVISTADDLADNLAVSHDITRVSLREKGHDIAVIEPETAAEHLTEIVRGADFTLFEYFQTDLSGHTRQYEQAAETLRTLDRFLAAVESACRQNEFLLIMTSDHGNIEDLSTRGHTRNLVPLIAVGPGADAMLSGAKSLMDVTPRLLKLMLPQDAG